MNASTRPIIVLPGASGQPPDLTFFTADPADVANFKVIGYPGWQRYVIKDFSAEVFIAELVSQIETIVPRAPIRILGISIGGHFGYAVALHLQARGRQVAGFCALDTFMVDASAPRAGWKGRALALCLKLLHERRVGDLGVFVRSRMSRAFLRLAGGRLPYFLRKFAASGQLPLILSSDPVFEQELSMRLLLREAAPWVGSLDAEPAALKAPAILIRTADSRGDDPAWDRRCPGIKIFEIPGTHQTIFEPENIPALRETFITATKEWYRPS